MTDYIEWILEMAEDEKEHSRVLLTDWSQRGFVAPGAPWTAAGVGMKTAAWGYATPSADAGAQSVVSFDHDGSPRKEAAISTDEASALRGEHSESVFPSALWTECSFSEDAFRPAALVLNEIGGARKPEMGGAAFLDKARRTYAAASALERRWAAGQTLAETETVPSSAGDPSALDLVFQRDARRYDGAFTLY